MVEGDVESSQLQRIFQHCDQVCTNWVVWVLQGVTDWYSSVLGDSSVTENFSALWPGWYYVVWDRTGYCNVAYWLVHISTGWHLWYRLAYRRVQVCSDWYTLVLIGLQRFSTKTTRLGCLMLTGPPWLSSLGWSGDWLVHVHLILNLEDSGWKLSFLLGTLPSNQCISRLEMVEWACKSSGSWQTAKAISPLKGCLTEWTSLQLDLKIFLRCKGSTKILCATCYHTLSF